MWDKPPHSKDDWEDYGDVSDKVHDEWNRSKMKELWAYVSLLEQQKKRLMENPEAPPAISKDARRIVELLRERPELLVEVRWLLETE